MSKNKANIGGFFKRLWSTWFVENTAESSLGVTENVYHIGNVGIGDFSGSNVDDNLVVNTDGGAGITIRNTAGGQTSPFLTFDNIDNTEDTILTPRDGSALNIEYGPDELMDLDTNGSVQFNEYGSGNFTGTPTFDIQVDSAGNFIEVPIVDNDTDIDNVGLTLSGTDLTVSVTENGNTLSDTVNLSSLIDDTDIASVSATISAANILTISVVEDGNTVTDTVDLSQLIDDTNPWLTTGTTTPADGVTGNIYHNGIVSVGTTDGAVRIYPGGNISTGPDIQFDVQGLLQSESNQYYHSQTGNHQFIGGNTAGAAGSTPLVDFNQNGEVEFNQYGNGAFTGTPAFDLQVSADGSVIEVPVVAPVTPNLTITRTQRPVVFAQGQISSNGVPQYTFNATVSRVVAGTYDVTFGSNHPGGNDYVVALSALSDVTGDEVKIHYSNKTATGFRIETTVDDNGGTADPNTDNQFDFTVYSLEDVITDITSPDNSVNIIFV